MEEVVKQLPMFVAVVGQPSPQLHFTCKPGHFHPPLLLAMWVRRVFCEYAFERVQYFGTASIHRSLVSKGRQHCTGMWLGLRGTPPPLAQARPRSQKSGQNGGSTPTPCLDKAVHAHDTCDSQTGNNIVSHD